MNRKLSAILGNSQRLDGGAMFGNAPKALWARWLPPDEQNRVPLACRALLVQEPNRNILIETGIGAFFEPKLKERFGIVEAEHVLLDSLSAKGLSHTDIDIVILSHLHFDHAGGLLSPYEAGVAPSLLFPNATYVVGKTAWDRARNPHFRDRASFLPQLNALLEASGRVHVVDGNHSDLLGAGWFFHRSNGHTPGLLVTEITMPDGPVVFVADMMPGAPWVHLPITMGYDRFPEQLIDEKQALLSDLLDRQGRLFFTHDPNCAMAKLSQDERGRFKAIHLVPDIQDLTS